MEKIKAIMEMEPPQNIGMIQKLTMRVTTLNKFVSRSSKNGFPFSMSCTKYSWNEDQDRTFKEWKHYLSNLPLMSQPEQGDSMYMYLAISPQCNVRSFGQISRNNPKTSLICEPCFPRVESRYLKMEMLPFALEMIVIHTWTYFQAHLIKVINEPPMQKFLQKLGATRHLLGLLIKLCKLDIEYLPRQVMKG